jgi:hypothetical protein
MDSRFVPAFVNQIRILTANAPYDWISAMINDAITAVLHPSSMRLREDGTLFLLVNIAEMIVKPWQETEQRDFRSTHSGILFEDIRDILAEARAIASAESISDISANLLLNVTATRRGGKRTRGLDIWE